MCGIAGIVALDGFAPQTLIAMTQMIAYRGPDGYGFAYASAGGDVEIHHGDEKNPRIARPQIGLGNRRLAILDLSSKGNQPMQIENAAFCITYNGEIYNYREVRQELSRLGHRFASNTDTEVLLRSYQEWGERCLERLNGMWSFAIWDRLGKRLFCARDRFGVKPFYYSLSGRTFFFGSEIKQILAASGIKRIAHPQAVIDFLEWGVQDHLEKTSFEGVFQLPGGSFLTLDLHNELAPKIAKFWELKTEPQLRISAAEATEEFRSRFERSVKIRLRSDVPVGVSLSGGLDSSAILCEANRISPGIQFPCFSACFEDARIDEREFMTSAASAANSTSHRTFPEAEAFWKACETITYHQDEPIGGPSVFAQWSVMVEARKARVPVLLGGQGGDESLCGYRKYYLFYILHLARTIDTALLREVVALARNAGSIEWSSAAISRYLPRLAQKKVSAVERLGNPELLLDAQNTSRQLGRAHNIAERQKIDLLKVSLPKLLRHEDRNSMAHSIESRMPFLDYELVEFLVRCPATFKMKDGWTKWLLRNALAGELPDKIRLRKSKLGFNAPDARWLQVGLLNGQRNIWQGTDLRMRKFLSERKLATECSRFLNHKSGALPAETLFRALSLETWARVHDIN